VLSGTVVAGCSTRLYSSSARGRRTRIRAPSVARSSCSTSAAIACGQQDCERAGERCRRMAPCVHACRSMPPGRAARRRGRRSAPRPAAPPASKLQASCKLQASKLASCPVSAPPRRAPPPAAVPRSGPRRQRARQQRPVCGCVARHRTTVVSCFPQPFSLADTSQPRAAAAPAHQPSAARSTSSEGEGVGCVQAGPSALHRRAARALRQQAGYIQCSAYGDLRVT
jgi:hypothetical protein